MKKQIVFGASHTPEFIDKWVGENEKVVQDLIESGVLEDVPRPLERTKGTETKKRPASVKRVGVKRAAHAQ